MLSEHTVVSMDNIMTFIEDWNRHLCGICPSRTTNSVFFFWTINECKLTRYAIDSEQGVARSREGGSFQCRKKHLAVCSLVGVRRFYRQRNVTYNKINVRLRFTFLTQSVKYI